MATAMRQLVIALRGSEGVWLADGPPSYSQKDEFPRSQSKGCRTMTFSRDGSLFAYCNGQKVLVVSTTDNKVLCEADKPRTSRLQISPCNNLLATWEPYAVIKGQQQGTPNLNLWKIPSGELSKGFIQKKADGWCLQWTSDEAIAARIGNSEVHFFENNNFDEIVNRLHLQKISDFSISSQTSTPYHVAAYVPGSKGQPSFVRVYQYPNFGGPNSALANKSFYKADKVELKWNKKGSALLVLAATESSADSYYGEQGLHFVATNGESCLVPRDKNGPVYHVEWNPDSMDFCVVYGFMPAKATLFNLKCEPIFDFGTGPRNVAYYNPQGNVLVLAGFGNLQGNLEFWDVKNKRQISNPKAPDSTYFEWAPDGQHIVTATCTPRLRVGNGYKIWHYSGVVLFEQKTTEEQELWEVGWQPAPRGTYPLFRISHGAPSAEVVASSAAPAQATKQQEPAAYIPPHMRGKVAAGQPAPKSKYRDDYEPPSNVRQQQLSEENMSKTALKNKKKREAKKAKQDQAQPAEQPAPVPLSDAGDTTGDPEKDKKIKNLKKKLQQVEKLKEQKAQGKVLEKNQLTKLETEAEILKELSDLQL